MTSTVIRKSIDLFCSRGLEREEIGSKAAGRVQKMEKKNTGVFIWSEKNTRKSDSLGNL